LRILIALSILGASILSSAAVYFTVAPWKIEYANDVGKYYVARMALSQENNLADLIIAPFYRTLSDSSVEAPQTKPVYMAALNVGYAIYDVFYPGQPNRKPFFTFTMFTFWLLFLTVCLVGWRFGHPFLGILAAVISLIGPWSFVYLYYPAYTQFSMVFYLLSFLCITGNRSTGDWKILAAGGVFASLALLSNSSMIVYVFGLGVFILINALPDWKTALKRGLIFVAGAASVFLFFQILKYVHHNPHMLESPFELLYKYYGRSAGANHFLIREGFVKAPKVFGMFFIILRRESPILLALLFALMGYCGYTLSRLGWKKAMMVPDIRAAITAWLPAGIAVLAIDFAATIQVGRSYIIAYPLIVMGAVFLGRAWLAEIAWISRPIARVAAAVLVAAFCVERAHGLYQERLAFHGFDTVMSQFFGSGKTLAMLRSDMHEHVVLLFEEEIQKNIIWIDDMRELGDLVKNKNLSGLILGPEIETIMVNAKVPPRRPIDGRTYYFDESLGLQVQKVVKLPFYGLYPLLVFEDEFDAWRMISGEFGEREWLDGRGVIRLYPLKAVSDPVGSNVTFANDLTSAVSSFSASNSQPGFGPEKLVVEGITDRDAWHGQLQARDDFPQWIEVEFTKPVVLEALALQSQHGDKENLKRAPQSVEVVGEIGKGGTVRLGKLNFEFTENGQWKVERLPQTKEAYNRYRLILWSNQGSSDYVTVQGLRFGGPIDK